MGRARVLRNMTLRRAERDIQIFYRALWANDHPVEIGISWYHVYQLVDPRDGIPFYVGKGGPHRLAEHKNEAKLGVMSAKCVRIRQIEDAGLDVEFRTVGLFAGCDRTRNASQFEAQLIREGGDALTNNQRFG